MSDSITAYPLSWPVAFPRAAAREPGNQFKTSLAGALRNVRDSLRLFSVDSKKQLTNLVISSNVTLGDDNPKDSAVAVWFTWDGLQVCIPIDRYQRVEANLQAIHLVIEARRTELRHGGLAIVRATFAGFKALPPPNWRRVLGITSLSTRADAEAAYKKLRSQHHPDKGGKPGDFNAVEQAWTQAQQELP